MAAANNLGGVSSQSVWSTAARGLLLLAFGFIAVLWPGLTLATLVFWFALYVVVAGVMNLVMSFNGMGRTRNWFFSLLIGIIEIAIGVWALQHPGVSMATLIMLLGTLFIARGVLEVVDSLFSDMLDDRTKPMMWVLGALSIVAGVIIVLYPASGGLGFTWALGAYAFVVGSMLVALSLEFRGMLDGRR